MSLRRDDGYPAPNPVPLPEGVDVGAIGRAARDTLEQIAYEALRNWPARPGYVGRANAYWARSGAGG